MSSFVCFEKGMKITLIMLYFINLSKLYIYQGCGDSDLDSWVQIVVGHTTPFFFNGFIAINRI